MRWPLPSQACAWLRASVRVFLLLLLALCAAAPARAQQGGVSFNVGSNLGTFSLGQLQFPLTASGGSGTYSWSVVDGSLPPGLSIRSDVRPWWFPPNASAGLIGVATTPGDYTFTLQVSDGASSAVQECTIVITTLSVKTPYTLPDALVGVPYSYGLSAVGYAPGATLTWLESGSLPPGLSLSSDGVLSGTPATAGFFSVPFSLSDGTHTIYWNLNVGVYDVRITTDGLLPNATVGQSYVQAITATGGTGSCTFTLSGSLPPGLSFDAGTISGTPTGSGYWNFNIIAQDESNHSYWKPMTLVVLGPTAQLPSVTANGVRVGDCTIGVQCNPSFSTRPSGGTPPFTWAASGLPDGMSIRWGTSAPNPWLWPGDAELWGVPTELGNFNVTMTVTDGAGAIATNTFALHVSALQQNGGLPNGTIGSTYSQVLQVLGGSGPYTAAQTGGHLPAGLSFDGVSLQVSGTPAEGGGFNAVITYTDIAGNVLTYPNYFSIANHGDTPWSLWINSNPNGDLGTGTVNVPYSNQLTACCMSPLLWSVTSGTLPPGLSLSPDGALSGTPTAVGQYSFTVRAADASSANNYTARLLTLTIADFFATTPYNLPFANAGTPYSLQFQASGGSGVYTWAVAAGNYLPLGLTLTSNGLLVGSPTSLGQFTFRLNIADAVSLQTTFADFNISIYPFGQYPPLSIPMNGNLGTFSIGEVQYALTATGGSGSYTWSVVDGSSLPPGLALRTDGPPWFPSTASAGIIGVATTPGTYPFTLRVNDGAQTVDLPATITITALTMQDLNTLPDAFQGMAYSYRLTALGNSGSVTWAAPVGLPPGIELNATTGELSGTPTTPGFFNVNVQVSQTADGATVSRTLNLGVYGIHLETSTPLIGGVDGELPNATTEQPYSARITASGGAGTYTFTANSLPGGLVLDQTSGAIAGTFTWGLGQFWFTVTATDSSGASYTRSFTIHGVASPPVLPALTVYGERFDDCTIGVPCSRAIASGATAPFTWTASGLPDGMSLRFGGASGTPSTYVLPGDAELWGVPTELGDFDVTVTVTDATGAQASNAFPLHVSELLLYNSLVGGRYGTGYSHTFRVLGGTPAYTSALFTSSPSSRLPVGLTLDGVHGMVSGTPLETGGFSPDLVFTDGANPQHVLHIRNYFFIADWGVGTIQINNNGDLGTWVAGTSIKYQISACCVPSYDWSVVGGSLPDNVSLNQSTGLLSGGPLVTGIYTFLVRVRNANDPDPSTNFAVRQFTMAVTPLSTATGYTLPFGNVASPYSQLLQVNGATGATTWSVAPYNFLPPGLSLSSGGELSGTPTASGQFHFTVNVSDSAGYTQAGAFSLAIYPVGGAPPLLIPMNGNFGTFSIGEIQLPLSATGGNGTYAWSIVGGTLPPGVSLRVPPDLSPWFSSNTSAGLIGIATVPGTYTFTLRVTSGNEHWDQACTIKVTLLRGTDQYTLPDAFVGQPYTYNLGAAGNARPVTFAPNNPSAPLPPGLTMDASGVIWGTPTTSGYYFFDYSMDDGMDSVGRRINLSVFDLRIATPGELPNATQNTGYSAQIVAAGGTPPYDFATYGGLPGGLALNGTTGEISGTPNAGAGNYGFWLTVTDAIHVSYARMMAINIIGVPKRLPSISPYGNSWDDCTYGVPCSRGIWVGSGGTAPFTWSAIGLPEGLSIAAATGATNKWMTPGDGEIVGVPAEIGTFNVQVTVRDADDVEATNTFPLRISRLMARDFDGTGTRGEAFEPFPFPVHYRRVRVIGGEYSDYPSYTSAIVAGQLPAGLSLDATTQVVSGTPLENGSFNITLNITDLANPANTLRTSQGLQIGGGTTTISINNSDLGWVTIGQSYSYQLSACCVPTPYTWSTEPSGTALPAGLTLSPGGLLSGTVVGSPGPVTFLVRAADSTNPANYGVRQLTLRLTSLSITTNSSLPIGNVGTEYSKTFTATGGTGAITWTMSSGTLPPGLTLSTAGVLSGTPTAQGQASFTVLATDTASHTASKTFSLSIYCAGCAPPLGLTIGSSFGPWIVETRRIELTASGGVPPYHYSLTPAANVIPGMRVQDGAPLPTNFSNTITGGYIGVITASGTYTTSIRVTDSTNATADKAITITVSPLTQLSRFNLPKATVNTAYSFTMTPFGGTSTYSWSATNLPPGLSIDPASGVISGTPTVTGTFGPNITATDVGASKSAGVGYSFVVNPFAITTGGVLPQGTVNTAYSQTLEAPNCGSGCTWSTTSSSVPSGLSLSTAGVISGTPTSSSNSFFTVQASGSNGTVQKVLALYVGTSPVQALSISTGATLGYTTIGTLPGTALTAQGGTPPYAWSLQSGALPTGVSLQAPGETLASNFGPGFTYISGRPRGLGAYNFTLSVTDAASVTVTKAFTWTISALNNQYTSLPLSGTSLTYNVAYTQPLLFMGGTSNYTWAATSAMPPGLTLNTSTGVVSGTPTNTGTFTIPIQVTDDASNTLVSNVTFTIGSGTTATIGFGLGARLGTLQLGQSSSFNLNPSGGTGPYTITALTALPPGFGLEFGDSLLSGASGSYLIAAMPLAAGTFSFTIQAQDTLGNIGVRTFTATVAPFILFSPTTLRDGSVGVPYSESILAWDNVGAVIWSVASGSTLPSGLSLSSAGVISGTSTQTGNFTFTLSATDPSTAVRTYTFTLRVSNIAITDPAILPAATVGVPYTYTFTGVGGASRTWSATFLPNGLTMSAAGTITGTPTTAATNAWFVTVTVADGVVQFSKQFSLFVVNATPTLLDYSLSSAALSDVSVGQSVSITLSPFNGVPPYTWSVAGGSALPPGLNLISGSALPSNFNPSSTLLAGAPTTAGPYTFDLIATDAAGTQVRRTFTLTVSSITILSGSPRTAMVGTAYAEQFTAVGGTPPYTFSLTPTGLIGDTLPPGFSWSSSGVISGTTTSTGNYSFRLRVQDAAGNSFSRGYTLTVTNAFGLRVTTGNSYAPVGIGAEFQLLTNGSSTYSWSLEAGSQPPGFALVTEGVDTYLRGAAAAPGTYTYTLRATDTANASNTADRAFTFKVSPMQAVSPSGLIDDLPSGQVGTAYSATIKVAGGTPPYTFTESPFAPLPPGLTLSSEGVLSGTPTAIGTFTIAPIVTDAAAQTLYVRGERSPHVVVTPAGTAAPLEFAPNAELPEASAGAPYEMPLQFWVGGGAPPLAFSVAPGSSLPPGLALMLGTNGVPTMIGGAPSTAGTYSFSLIATDSVNQTVTVPFSLNVSTLALDYLSLWLPVGVVGTSYSVPLVASGGTAPYTIQFIVGNDSGVPPGLTIDGSGNLSGTPTYPGIFVVVFAVTDSAGKLFGTVRLITIDNAIGEAPAVSLAPNPIQIAYTIGTAAPAPVAVSVSTSTGASPFTLALSGIPGATLSASNGSTPETVNLNLNVASLTAGTFTGILGVSAPQAVNRFDGVPVTLTVCEFTVFPLAGSAPDTGGAGTFNVSAGGTCEWTAVTFDPWITITGGTSGTGIGAVSYSLAPNGSVNARTGTISVNGAVYTVTQFGSLCTYTVNPSAGSVPNTGGTGNFTVSTNGACGWTAVASDPWLTVTGGASGTGNATVSYSAAPNATPDARSATITVNGAVYPVTQFGTDCSFAISPAGVMATAAGGTATVSVTASSAMCGWTASSVNLGVSPASGSGTGTLQIFVPANPLPPSRWLTATIAGETFSVYQTGINCTVSLGSSSALAPAGASAGSVDVTTPPGCTYDTVLGPSWLTVTSGGSGVGPGTLVYSVEPNSTTYSRTGTLTIGGQAFQITQAPLPCSVTLNTTGLGSPFGPAASTGTIAVTANGPNCSWNGTSGATWASVAPGSGTGNAVLTVSVSSNALSTVARAGELTIAGQTVNLSQAGTTCTFELESSSGSASASGGSASVRVIAPGVCGWSASSNAPWLTITSSGSAGTSAVQFSVAPNPLATPRSGTLTIAGLTYTVDQAGAACAFTVAAPTTSPLLSADGASNQSFGFSSMTTGCSPAAVSYANWITVDATTFGGTSGNVTYSVAPNPFGTTRSGTIQVGNALFTVVQSGATCAYSLNAYGKVFRVAGGSDTLLGSPTAVGCTPAYGTDQPSFITLGPLTGPVLNIFSLPYEVSPFTTSLTAVVRLGRITFGGQILTIKQLSW